MTIGSKKVFKENHNHLSNVVKPTVLRSVSIKSISPTNKKMSVKINLTDKFRGKQIMESKFLPFSKMTDLADAKVLKSSNSSNTKNNSPYSFRCQKGSNSSLLESDNIKNQTSIDRKIIKKDKPLAESSFVYKSINSNERKSLSKQEILNILSNNLPLNTRNAINVNDFKVSQNCCFMDSNKSEFYYNSSIVNKLSDYRAGLCEQCANNLLKIDFDILPIPNQQSISKKQQKLEYLLRRTDKFQSLTVDESKEMVKIKNTLEFQYNQDMERLNNTFYLIINSVEKRHEMWQQIITNKFLKKQRDITTEIEKKHTNLKYIEKVKFDIENNYDLIINQMPDLDFQEIFNHHLELLEVKSQNRQFEFSDYLLSSRFLESRRLISKIDDLIDKCLESDKERSLSFEKARVENVRNLKIKEPNSRNISPRTLSQSLVQQPQSRAESLSSKFHSRKSSIQEKLKVNLNSLTNKTMKNVFNSRRPALKANIKFNSFR